MNEKFDQNLKTAIDAAHAMGLDPIRLIDIPSEIWAIKGPRGYWASDGAQSAWLSTIDLTNPYGVDMFATKERAEAYIEKFVRSRCSDTSIEAVLYQ